MIAYISQSAWCLRQSALTPHHYHGVQLLNRVPSKGDSLHFSARVGTEDRGYDVRVSLDFHAVKQFYRDRCQFSDERLAEEIAFLSAKLAERLAKKDAAA